jgi:hypothetical protein
LHREGAQLNSAPVDVLDQGRLAGRRVDREHGDAVLAASEHLFTLELDCRCGAIGEIDEAAVGMHMDGAGTLPRR